MTETKRSDVRAACEAAGKELEGERLYADTIGEIIERHLAPVVEAHVQAAAFEMREGMNNKTELQAAINHALGEMQINWEGNLFSDGDDLDLAHEIIESHIAPLLRSVRNAAIEESRIAYDAHNHVLNYPHTNPRRVPQDSTDECLACGLMLSDPVHLKPEETRGSRIRALTQPAPERKEK